MREIKFRAWDKRREEIYGNGRGMSYGEREDFDDMVGWRFAHEESLGEEPRVLMQYTGLKDISGVEIFEEDILGDTLGHVIGTVVCVNDPEYRYCIKQLNQTADYGYLPFEPDEDYEVVGNRFENPELLKEGEAE
ncbi:MAG: YopX family protein [Sporolactobacillus sp.]